MSDPHWDNVSLLMHMDGANGSTTFVDETGKTVSNPGTAVISTTQSKFGGSSGYFDGVNGQLTPASDNDFGHSAGSITVEAWVYQTSGAVTSPKYILRNYASVGDYATGWVLAIRAPTNTLFALVDGINLIEAVGHPIPLNEWVYVAFCFTGSTTYLFINGVLVANGGTYASSRTTANLAIGYDPNSLTRHFNGYIDEVRITKGVARYTANFTPPTSAFQGGPTSIDPHWDNVSLLMHMDGANGSTTFVDERGNNVVAVGATISTEQWKFGGASGQFVDTRAEIRGSTACDFTGQDFTVEAWINPTSYPLNNNGVYVSTILSKYVFPSSQAFFFYISGTASALTSIGLELRDSSQAIIAQTYAARNFNLNEWVHVAFCRIGSTMKIFVEGQELAVIGGTVSGEVATLSSHAYIGSAEFSGVYPMRFRGYIDELRITKGFARYTSAFTPPTEPFSNTSAQPLIDAILSGQLAPSPLSQLLVTNWPVIGVETSGTLSPSGFITINNPQIIEGLFSGAMSPTGSVMVSAYWLIEAVASGRMSPSQAAHILVDNLDPNQVNFAQIIGEIELYSRVILSARMAGKLDLSGTMLLTPEHEAQVAGTLRLIDGAASLCGCSNG